MDILFFKNNKLKNGIKARGSWFVRAVCLTPINNQEFPIMAKKLKELFLKMEKKDGFNNIISGHSNTLDKYYLDILDKYKLPVAKKIMNISEGGFHVLEVDKEKNKIYYRHLFKDFRDLALQVYNLLDIKPLKNFPLN